MTNNKKLIILTSLVFLALVCIFFNQKTENGNSVRISGNIPLTGDLAVYGSYIKDGSEMAYFDLQGNYRNVPNVVFDWQDNHGNAKDAVSAIMKQSLDNPDIYISGIKPQTAAITDLVTAKNIPHFTWILDQQINKN